MNFKHGQPKQLPDYRLIAPLALAVVAAVVVLQDTSRKQIFKSDRDAAIFSLKSADLLTSPISQITLFLFRFKTYVHRYKRTLLVE